MTITATSVTARSLAPDLARGFMLLLIALAHAPTFAAATPVTAFVKSLIADNQARAMFVFLFGYGLGQLAAKHTEWPGLRGLLRRRGLWLTVIGFANTVILVPIDIVAVYGVTLLLAAPLVRARDRVLLWTAALTLIPATLLLAWQSVNALTGVTGPMTDYLEPTLLAHLWANIPSWAPETLIETIMVLPGMLAGIWAARRRFLDEPARHARLLRTVTVTFLGIALAGRLPAALMLAGAWEQGPVWFAAIAHDLTGYLGGIGMAAAIGLVAIRARGPVTVALAALGQRSLTFYLLQSVIWLALFYPFTLGLSVSAPAAFAIAVAVWAGSVALADGMRRAGYRGPAEIVLRKLSYR